MSNNQRRPGPGQGNRRGGGDHKGRTGGQPLAIRSAPAGGNPSGGQQSVQPGIYIGDTPLAPDKTVTELENKLVKVTNGAVVEGRFPGRTGYGTEGTPVILRTNHFHLRFASELGAPDNNRVLYRYEVEILGDVSKIQKRRAIEQLLLLPPFQNEQCATDYAKIIVTTADLKHNRGQKIAENKILELPGKDGATPPTATDAKAPQNVQQAAKRKSVKYNLLYNGSFSAQDLINFLASTDDGAFYSSYGDFVQLLNIIMCRAPNTAAHVASLPGNRFYPNQDHPGVELRELTGGLVALRGYRSSVRPGVGRVLVNLNVASGAFYKAVPLLDLLHIFNNPDGLQRENFIRMLKVAYHRPGKQPMKGQKTIIGFAKSPRFGNAKNVTFEYEDRTGPRPRTMKTSVLDYFEKQMGVTLKFPNVPVVNVGNRANPIYIPMEFCTVLPGQPYRRFLSGDQTTEMLNFAARFPNQNAMSIAGDQTTVGNGVRLFQLRNPANPQIQSVSVQPFGFKIDTSMLTVHGRILPTPAVQYGEGKKGLVQANNGAWNCANKKFVEGGSFSSWAVLVLNLEGASALNERPPSHMQTPEVLFNAFAGELAKYGIKMGVRTDDYTETLKQLTVPNRNANNKILDDTFRYYSEHNVQMLFIVLPKHDQWLHGRIKYYGDTQYGIISQCAVGKKLQKPGFGQGMFFGNLALKINVKGGGVNHSVPNVLANPIDSNTMLMGIDVTHPSPASAKGAPSIAVAVASRDSKLYQWPGSIATQKGKQEMVDAKSRIEADAVDKDNLKIMVIDRLKCWQKYNKGQLPKKIVLYRDGVSEGQYKLVLELELPHFLAAFNQMYGAEENHPRLAIIVVGKRHNVRFYPTKIQDTDYDPKKGKGSFNCKPGTVVDRGVTSRGLHDFYLQAHAGLQGNAKPAHYVVIKDDIGFSADSLEAITHGLSYMFARATKAVSIVPPAYYADILAERARAYLYTTLQEDHADDSTTASGSTGTEEWNGKIHPNLLDSFFYL